MTNVPVEVNQIRKWYKEKLSDIFIVIGHEKDVDCPTCVIKYISSDLQGLIISDYYADYIEKYSDLIE
jgi:hypothetical protein